MFKKVILSSVIGCFLLAGCGLETYHSGDIPTKTRLGVIKPHQQTKEQVLRILGTPAFEINETNTLVYMRQIKDSQAFMRPKEVERDVYIFRFNAENQLTERQHLTLADARDIPFEKDTTQTQKKELSVMKQLVQNFGRYDAGGKDSSVRQ